MLGLKKTVQSEQRKRKVARWPRSCKVEFWVDVCKNKPVAAKIHLVKGRERDAIELPWAWLLPKHHEKSNPRNVSNMFRIAGTRAQEKLVIIQWDNIEYATQSSRTDNISWEKYHPLEKGPRFLYLQWDPHSGVPRGSHKRFRSQHSSVSTRISK